MKNKIESARKGKGMKQAELAVIVGIGRSTMSDIERGAHVPNVYVAIRIARALGLSVEALFPEEEV